MVVQQCSAALRRCHSIQLKINDLRDAPRSAPGSPAMDNSGVPGAAGAAFTISAVPARRAVSSQAEAARDGSAAAVNLGHAFGLVPRALSVTQSKGKHRLTERLALEGSTWAHKAVGVLRSRT